MEKIKLTTILYYDLSKKKNLQLKKGLQEYKFLLKALGYSLDLFQSGDLERFDALVGENACQIRTIKIAIIKSQKQIDHSRLKEVLSFLMQKLDDFLSDKMLSSLMSSNVSLQEVLEKEDLEVYITSDEMFLLNTFLLSEAKAPHLDEKCFSSLFIRDKVRPNKLKKLGDISTAFIEKIIRSLRRSLSEKSVDFMKELAGIEGIPERDRLMNSDKFLYFHRGVWPTLPMFWTYKVLLQVALKRKIPLILRASFVRKQRDQYQVLDEEILFFEPVQREQGFFYFLSEPDEDSLRKPACMIKGIVLFQKKQICKLKWTEQIKKISIVDVILSGAADHRQYPDPNLKLQVDDPVFDDYVKMAREKGFSINNPSTFFIRHVHPILVSKGLHSKRLRKD